MSPRLFLLGPLLAAGLLPLAAQIITDGPIKMNPELALAIPLAMANKHDVTVKFPILINFNTVVQPGMVLRNLYVPPIYDDSTNLTLAHKGDMEDAYSRAPSSASDEPRMPPEIAHAIEAQRREVWEVPVNFQLALAQLPTTSLHLIFQPRHDNRELQDQRLDFMDGLFLGSPTGGVTVLAVEIGSKAEQGGLKAGDQILAVGGTPVSADLSTFPALYLAVRQNAEDSHATSFGLTVRSPGESGSHLDNVPTPPTIKSMLNEGL